MKDNLIDYVTTALGVLLLGIGLFLLKTLSDPQGIMLPIPYICIGLGFGTFGQGMGNIISKKVIKKNPEIEKQFLIDSNDERNIALDNRAKAKVFDIMIFVFGALMISFALMGTEISAVLLLVGAYLFVVGCEVYYRFKYDKEM